MSDENRVCLVTGASRGIGRAVALALGRRGDRVIGTATGDAGARTIDAALAAAEVNGRGMVLDVTDSDAVARVVKDIEQDFGPVTVLVNNAGITRDNLLLRMREADWDAIIDTDLKSVYRVTKACLRGMTKARSGRIINITSVVGVMGNAGQTNYAAAKAGMIGFTRALAAEVAARHITANAVAPGFIDTDMTQTLAAEQRQSLLATIPLGRLGSPEDVAHAVAFLASAEAGYITGTTIHVNGGMYMN